MDKSIALAVLTAVLGAISGAALAYIRAILKYRKELEAEFDKELRKERIRTYPDLWRQLELLARYDRPAPLDVTHLQDLSVSMRKWYFQTGGLFLSERTRVSYFRLKELLQKTIASLGTTGDGELGEAEELLDAASRLRRDLAGDISSRRSSPVAGT
jgi:hypothetical protein